MNFGGCGVSEKSSSVKLHSTGLTAASFGQSCERNCGTCARGTRISRRSTSRNCGASASGRSERGPSAQAVVPSVSTTGGFTPGFIHSVISPSSSSPARNGNGAGSRETSSGWSRPTEMRGCPAILGNKASRSFAGSWTMPGVSPPARSSAASNSAASCAVSANGPDFAKALSGDRPRRVTPSNTTTARPRAAASARFGGKITWISSGSPASERRSWTDSLAAAAGVTVASDPLPTAACAAGFRRCRPTATECAQMEPSSRDWRQVQMFSTSKLLLMTNPAR